jgi:hypothetical protein
MRYLSSQNSCLTHAHARCFACGFSVLLLYASRTRRALNTQIPRVEVNIVVVFRFVTASQGQISQAYKSWTWIECINTPQLSSSAFFYISHGDEQRGQDGSPNFDALPCCRMSRTCFCTHFGILLSRFLVVLGTSVVKVQKYRNFAGPRIINNIAILESNND